MNQKFLLKWTEKGPMVMETKNDIINSATIKKYVADLVDYVSYIDFGDTKYEIIVDDEGLCKNLPVTFVVMDTVKQEICSLLVGPCLIVKTDNEGNTLALEFEDIIKIVLCIKKFDGTFVIELDNNYINETNDMLKSFFEGLIKV